MIDSRPRCPWVRSEREAAYHDEEWGVPVHEDRLLFEMLCLEGQVAGLSWETVLRKREGYREHFHRFELQAVAEMSDVQIEAALQDPGVIRHRGKLNSIVQNARAALSVVAAEGSLDAFLWQFVGGTPQLNVIHELSDYRTSSPESDAMSRALKARGFRFVGTTTMYAFMQAVGMVDDHAQSCWRRSG